MMPLRDSNPSGTRPVVTVAIIALNALAFLYSLGLGDEAHRLVWAYGLVPALLTGEATLRGGGDPNNALRLVVSLFLHGGWFHLIGNMWYLWIFGDNIEDRLGHVPFLLFYVACGLGASLIHVLFNPGSPVPTIGASGAIAGVLGAYFRCFPRARVTTFFPVLFFPMFLQLPAVVVLGFWFVIQVLNGGMTVAVAAQSGGGVAWWAHVGGFAVGYVLIRVLPCRRRRSQSVYVVPFDRS